MSDIQDSVRRFIESDLLFGPSDGQFSGTASFTREKIIDSTGFLELVTFLESKYGIVVEDNEMIPENLDSLQQIERYVVRKTAGARID